MARRGFIGNIPYTDPAGITGYINDDRYGPNFVMNEYKRARNAMIREMKKIEASGRHVFTERPPTVRQLGNNAREVAYALSDVYRFMYSKHGSLENILDTEAKFAATMKTKHIQMFKSGDVETAAKAREFLIYVNTQKDRKRPGYESVLRTYQKMKKGNTKNVSERMQRLYDEFLDWSKL